MWLSDWSLVWKLPGRELENETFSEKKPSFPCSANDQRRTGIFGWNRPAWPEILERMRVIPPPDERIDEEHFEWASCFDEDFLGRLPDGTIAFYLTWSGFACGPVSETVVVGIDCAAKREDGDDDAGEEWKRGHAGPEGPSYG